MLEPQHLGQHKNQIKYSPTPQVLIYLHLTILFFDTATLHGESTDDVVCTQNTKESEATYTPMDFILDHGEDGNFEDGGLYLEPKEKTQKITLLLKSFNLCGLQMSLG